MTNKLLVALLLVLCLLCACSPAAAPSPSPEPTPAPIPSPTPTPQPSSLTLTDESAEKILLLAGNRALREVDGSASKEIRALRSLAALRPDCHVTWTYEWNGQRLSSDTEELTVTDPAGLDEALFFLPKVKRVDLLGCSMTVEEMERYTDAWPEVDFLWMVSFGQWQVRSDITCFSTLRTGTSGSHRYTDEELYPLLRFCRHLRALDMGHNDLTDISLLAQMKELQVLILADNPNLADISPLAELSDLYYLELFLCRQIEDFSALYSLENMMDLNMSYCWNLYDLDFIENMPDFQNGWFRFTHVDANDTHPILQTRPDIRFVIGGDNSDLSSIAFGWRSTARNNAIRNAFTNWSSVKDFLYWDNVIYQ